MTESISQKKFLYDICVIRVILIVLLIIYHSLCPYTSDFWDNPQGIDIPAYYWIGRLSYSCMLETFVLISGVILGYQTIKRGKEALKFKHIGLGKLKRLIIPSIIFSILYFLIFMDLSSAPLVVVKTLLEGAGHMWFLPMLFWCFFGIYILNLLNLNRKIILPFLFIISIFSSLPLPFRLNLSLYYFFFFYLGYAIGAAEIDISQYISKKTIIILFLIFIASFPVLANFIYTYDEATIAKSIEIDIPLNLKYQIVYAIKRFSQLLYSSVGVALIYTSVNYLINHKVIAASPLLVKLSSYCFGVYIFQEFIIRIFYYKLNAIETLNPYIFPIASIIITLILSLALTNLTLKTKIGKFLIG